MMASAENEVITVNPETEQPFVRVNLKLKDSVHHKLRLWCLRNRYTLQDGLTEIVEHAMGMGK